MAGGLGNTVEDKGGSSWARHHNGMSHLLNPESATNAPQRINIVSSWDSPPFLAVGVRTLMTSRQGGMSGAPWATMNLGAHVGDAPMAVADNRRRVELTMGMPVLYLNQVHGCRVLHAQQADLTRPPATADAAWTEVANLALAVQVADCLPVLFSHVHGRGVGAAHAGWRGLCGGVLESTLSAMCQGLGCHSMEIEVWLGPCIGPLAFEVGQEVRDQFIETCANDEHHFRSVAGETQRWLMDLRGLARRRLSACGVVHISEASDCTWSDAIKYFSYRRDHSTGRMAALIGRVGA